MRRCICRHGINQRDLNLDELSRASWILSPRGTILRHRFDMMFRRAGLAPPVNVVDTTALLLITALLQQGSQLTTVFGSVHTSCSTR